MKKEQAEMPTDRPFLERLDNYSFYNLITCLLLGFDLRFTGHVIFGVDPLGRSNYPVGEFVILVQ